MPAAHGLPPVAIPPWVEEANRLWSFWDMNQFSAQHFLWIGHALEVIKTNCYTRHDGTADDPMPVTFMRMVDDETIREASESLRIVEERCREIGLGISAETAEEVREELGRQPGAYTWLVSKVSELQRLIQREMRQQLFFHVTPAQARFWPRPTDPLFGAKVNSSFPSAAFDIDSAGICLAVRMGTASVFHLMRVLETGLGALARRFDVSFEFTNWAPVLDQIVSVVRGMRKDPQFNCLPDCKEQQEFYSQAVSHFGVLKDAWRNHVMHVRGKYTAEEAEVIFVDVRAFMKKLAERLAE